MKTRNLFRFVAAASILGSSFIASCASDEDEHLTATTAAPIVTVDAAAKVQDSTSSCSRTRS